MYELAIIGAGGFGREVMSYVPYSQLNGVYPYTFYVDDIISHPPQRPLSQLDPERSLAVVAIGDPNARAEVVARLRHGQKFASVIHRTAITSHSKIGVGAVLAPYAVVTVDCTIGKHVHLNLHSDIGHDCTIGDYVTLLPSARVSGKCTIGNRVYIGSNAVIREGVSICDDVTIGAGSVVLRNITEAGTYVGVPAKRVK
jgi:sugar O-acyltransferase (sialic acid O-acetyltransferase NeuD family)